MVSSDQAHGLRHRVREQFQISGFRFQVASADGADFAEPETRNPKPETQKLAGRRASNSFLSPPTLVVYWNLGGMPTPINAPLLWHWQEGVRAATGWDIQSRLHVRGTAEQFADWQLLQWRSIADHWCILTHTSTPCRYADHLYLALRTEPSSLMSVYAALKSLYESLKEIPIIIVSREAPFARQVARILREHLQLNAWSEEPKRAYGQPTGYYRLLADCRYRTRTHTRANAHRTDRDCQTNA